MDPDIQFRTLLLLILCPSLSLAQTNWPDFMPTLNPAVSQSPVAAVVLPGAHVEPPAPNVPPDKARWSGTWSGWACPDALCDTKLIVEMVTAEGATMIYAFASAKQKPYTTRVEAVFVGGELQATLPSGAKLAYRMRNEGEVEFLYRSGTIWVAGILANAAQATAIPILIPPAADVPPASPVLVLGGVEIPKPPQDQTFSYESNDWGVAPASRPQGPPFGRPTPISIPGGRVIKTLELKGLLDVNKKVVVVDVLDSQTRTTVPGAYWMPGAGDSRFYGVEISRFAAALEKLTVGDKNRPVVFVCLSSECWESYNACLHAIEAGYKDVLWYRGGTNAWAGASLRRSRPERINW